MPIGSLWDFLFRSVPNFCLSVGLGAAGIQRIFSPLKKEMAPGVQSARDKGNFILWGAGHFLDFS
jgi:hypothetical protein